MVGNVLALTFIGKPTPGGVCPWGRLDSDGDDDDDEGDYVVCSWNALKF